jgi:HPr kinase/phosphorylase
MQFHASCAAFEGAGVLLLGRPGSGKSDLLLRLLDIGFALVADDRVDIDQGVARPPRSLAGLLEVRGLGIVRRPWIAEARLALAVELDQPAARGLERLPVARRHAELDLPLIALDPLHASAPSRIALALACAEGRAQCVTGAFA